MAVSNRERQREDITPKPDGSHDDLGVHPERREAEAADLETAYRGDSAKQGEAEADEKDALGVDDDDSYYNDEDDVKGKKKGKKRFFGGRISGKQAAGGGLVASLLLGGGFTLLTFTSGPAQFLHISQMLQSFHFGNNDRFMESRNKNIFLYMRNYKNGTRHLNNLGWKSNLLADKFETRLRTAGIELRYDIDGRSTGRVQSMLVDSNTPEGRRVLADARKAGIEVDAPDANGRHSIRIYGEGSTSRGKLLIKAATGSLDMGKTSNAMSNRLLINRAGVNFKPLRNTVREKGQDLADYYRGRKEERNKNRARGIDTDIKTATAETTTDAEGNTTTNQSAQEVVDEASDITRQIDAIDAGDLDAPNKVANIKSSLAVRGGGAALAVVGLACTAKSVGEAAEDMQYAKVILPMIRIGMEMVTVGAQIMSGIDVNFEELGALSADLYDPSKPANEKAFTGAMSIQAEDGNPQTGPDLPAELQPGNIEEEPAWLQALDIPGLNEACSVQNAVSGLPIIREVSGAVSALANAASGGLIENATDSIISAIAGDIEIINATGALLGNIANYGVLLAANDAAISTGGLALSPAEVGALDAERRAEERQELQEKSFYARVFDPYEKDSLVAEALLENPQLAEPSTAIASTLKAPASMLSNLGNMFSSLFTSRLGAQEEPYNYGIDEYGFTLEEMNNPAYEDPFANADIVEPRLDELNEAYSSCFGTTITAGTGDSGPTINSEETRRYSQTNECSDVPSEDREILTRYRFYIADTIAMTTLVCYELNESCNQLGFSGGAGSSPTEPSQTAGEVVIGDPFASSVDVACATGTNDIGVHTGYNNGNPIEYRLCAIPNIPSVSASESTPGSSYYIEGADGMTIVNSRVSGAVFAMANAAIADGVQLTARSAFRSNEHQSDLFRENGGDASLAAPPGFSNHQAGTAIDFLAGSVLGGGTCESRARAPGNAQWDWLFANAERFGYRQYSKESWHWDPSTSTNRCGPNQ